MFANLRISVKFPLAIVSLVLLTALATWISALTLMPGRINSGSGSSSSTVASKTLAGWLMDLVCTTEASWVIFP